MPRASTGASTIRRPAGRAAASGRPAETGRRGSWRAARARSRSPSTSSCGPTRWRAERGSARAGALPEAPARQPRSLREHAELLPHDARVHARGREPLREAAVHAGDDVLAADEPRVAHDPLRDQLRVLDAVRRVGDDARDEDLALGELDRLPHVVLVLVAWVRSFERECPRLDRQNYRQDLSQ